MTQRYGLGWQRLSLISNGVAGHRPDAMAVTGEARSRGDPRWLCKAEKSTGHGDVQNEIASTGSGDVKQIGEGIC